MVVADTHENAKKAAQKVIVKYEELPAILSIRDAIKFNSFHPNTRRCLVKGDVDSCFQSCDQIIEGEVQIGGQEHFYLEPNSSFVWTVDGGNEVHMISSTQVSHDQSDIEFSSRISMPLYYLTLCNYQPHSCGVEGNIHFLVILLTTKKGV